MGHRHRIIFQFQVSEKEPRLIAHFRRARPICSVNHQRRENHYGEQLPPQFFCTAAVGMGIVSGSCWKFPPQGRIMVFHRKKNDTKKEDIYRKWVDACFAC